MNGLRIPLSLFDIWSLYFQTNTSCFVSNGFLACFGLHTTLAWWPTDQVIASKDRSWKFHELSVHCQLQCLPTVKSSNEIGALLVLKYEYWLSFPNQIIISKKTKKKKPHESFIELTSNYHACHIYCLQEILYEVDLVQSLVPCCKWRK